MTVVVLGGLHKVTKRHSKFTQEDATNFNKDRVMPNSLRERCYHRQDSVGHYIVPEVNGNIVPEWEMLTL